MNAESCLPPPLYQKLKRKIITQFLKKHGRQKRPRSRSKHSQIRNSQQRQSCRSLPLNINDGTEEQDVESRIRISRGRVGGNVTGPVGRFKDSIGRKGVCNNEHSEDRNEFEKEMNPLDMNLSEMNLSETNPLKKKLLKKRSSLIQTEKHNECWTIAMK